MKLHKKINYIMGLILIVVILSIAALSYSEMKHILLDRIDKDLLYTAKFVSKFSAANNIDTSNNYKFINNESFNKFIKELKQDTDLDFILIINKNGEKYYDKTIKNINEYFVNGDEAKVFKTKQSYVEPFSNDKKALRAFSPIKHNDEIVGAVCLGIDVDKVMDYIIPRLYTFLPFLTNGLVLGIIGATFLSKNIKNSILNLEPEEITLSLQEKEIVLQSITEGIIAVDKFGKINMINKAATKILRCSHDEAKKLIPNLLKENIIRERLENGEVVNHWEIKIYPEVTILCNYNPIKNDKDETIGVVITFKDLSEAKIMAEELTGIKKLMWDLRAQNHEFMNKLHTISGLIQLEEYEEAISYISDVASKRSEVSYTLTHRIKDVSLAGMLLAKYGKAEEAKVNLEISEKCYLTSLPQYMSSDELVSIVGNLIENSLDAVKNDGSGKIFVSIFERNNFLNIIIKDNGPGISEDIKSKIFTAGFSTKEGSGRGFGMYVTKKLIDEYYGTINLNVDNGTTWEIKIPMKGRS